MTSEQLQHHIRRQPFEPFILHLADDEKIPVRHPEFILHVPGDRTCVVAHEEERVYSTIDLLLVSRITTPRRSFGRGRSNGKAA
jgi:hypothetical protein